MHLPHCVCAGVGAERCGNHQDIRLAFAGRLYCCIHRAGYFFLVTKIRS